MKMKLSATLEDYVRRECPKAFKNWDGTEFRVELVDNRGVKPSQTCTVTLRNVIGDPHAIMRVNVDTDVVTLEHLME